MKKFYLYTSLERNAIYDSTLSDVSIQIVIMSSSKTQPTTGIPQTAVTAVESMSIAVSAFGAFKFNQYQLPLNLCNRKMGEFAQVSKRTGSGPRISSPKERIFGLVKTDFISILLLPAGRRKQ